MKEITKCPSTLALGYSAYSPIAIKRLFDGKKVSPYLGFEIEEIACRDEKQRHVKLIDKRTDCTGCLSVSNHHENDGQSLTDGNGRVVLHCSYSVGS